MKKSFVLLVMLIAWCGAMPLTLHADDLQDSFMSDLS